MIMYDYLYIYIYIHMIMCIYTYTHPVLSDGRIYAPPSKDIHH